MAKRKSKRIRVLSLPSPELIVEATFFARKCGITTDEASALIARANKAEKIRDPKR